MINASVRVPDFSENRAWKQASEASRQSPGRLALLADFFFGHVPSFRSLTLLRSLVPGYKI